MGIISTIELMLKHLPEDFGAKSINVSYVHKKRLGKEYKGIAVKYSIDTPVDAVYIK